MPTPEQVRIANEGTLLINNCAVLGCHVRIHDYHVKIVFLYDFPGLLGQLCIN